MTPQAYPLELDTEDGERMIVIGWTASDGHSSSPTVAPVAVPLDGPAEHPVVVVGPVEYRRPSST